MDIKDIATKHVESFVEGDTTLTSFEQINSKLSALGYDVLINDKKAAEFVPSSRLHDVTSQRDNFKSQVTDLNKQLEDLKKASNDRPTQDKLQELIDNNTALMNELEKTKIDTEIMIEAKDANDPKDILNFVVRENISTDAKGKSIGVKKEVDRLRAEKPYLFAKVQAAKGGGDTGGKDEAKVGGMNAMIRRATGYIN